MADNIQCYQRLTFTREFEPTLQQFRQMIEADDGIRNTVKPEYAKKGLFSASIRFLIKAYVDAGWEAFVAAERRKLKKAGEENAAT